MADNWTVEGHYMEACTCEAVCPCITLSPPTEGSCTAIVGWQVKRGRYGNVPLDGLNVAVGVYSPGHMEARNWSVAVYIDERANAQQRDALTQIFGGAAGGHPARIAEYIAEVKGVHFVPITFETDGKRGTLMVAGVGGSTWEPIEGQNGGTVTVQGQPLAVSPGHPVVVGRASRAHFRDHGIEFDASGRQAMVAPFSYSGP
jgi:hypothetical protein